MRGKLVFLLLLVGGLTHGIAGSAWGCPSCKDALADNSSQGNIAYGFGWSIIFMLSMPYAILSAIGAYFYFLIRRARRLSPEAPSNGATIVAPEATVRVSEAVDSFAVGRASGPANIARD